MSDEQGWNGPGRSQPDPVQQLLAIVKAQDKRIAALERGSPLRAAGIGMTPDGMFVDSSLDVHGSLSSTGTASFGGDTTIGGNAAITGTLSLPAGIIDNDALANPLEVRSDYNSVTGIPYTTTETDRAPVTIAVPSGFVTAVITVVATGYCFNTTTTDSGLAIRAKASANNGGPSRWTGVSLTGLPANWSGTAQATLITALDVSNSSAVTSVAQVQAAWSAIPADSQHYVAAEVMVVFTR